MPQSDNAGALTTIDFVNFTRLPEAELKRIYEWRNLDYVRKAMDNQEPFTIEEHLAFCRNLARLDDRYYFQVRVNGMPCGVYDFQHVDRKTGEAECGIYALRVFGGHAPSISRASNLLAYRLGLKRQLVHILKSNERAVVYSLVKCHAQYEREDDKYVYAFHPVFKEDFEHDPFFKTHKCNTYI